MSSARPARRSEADVSPSAEELQARLEEVEDLLRAIRSGDVDSMVVSGPRGTQVYTLNGADHPYRILVEAMNEGAAILTADGVIVYSNRSFAAMLDTPLDEVTGSAMDRFVFVEDLVRYHDLIHHDHSTTGRGEVRLVERGGRIVPVYLSINAFESGTPGTVCAVVTNLTEHKAHQELVLAEAQERTKRKEAEAAGRRIASILESITDSFFSLDRRWRITDANQRAAATFGTTRDDLLGQVFWDIFPRGRAPELEEQYRTAMTERTAIHSDGPSAILPGRWFERHIYPTDEGLAVFFRDITERQHAEDELRRSEANLADAQQLSHTGSWTWNTMTRELRFSLELYRILGLDPETFQPTVENTQRLIHPHDLPVVQQTFEKAIRDRRDFKMRYRVVRLDGSTRHLYGLGRPVLNGPGDLEFMGSIVDVTEQKQAEEHLRRSESYLVEGQRISHTGSWAWNASTGELFWSLEHFRICGADPETFTPTLESMRPLVHPHDRDALYQALATAIRDRTSIDREFRFVRPDGTVRHVHSLGHPVVNEIGEVVEYVGTTVDITERKEADAERARLLRQIVEAQEEERRRIALEMHDQFGQQLSALALKLSALRHERGRRHVLGEQLAELETMTRQLDTDLEQIISRLRPPALDDLGLVAALTNYVRHWSQHFGINANLHASGLEPGRLTNEIDTALYRITQEALINVAKHARAENVVVLLDERSGRVSLIVEDDGLGFDIKQPIGRRSRFGLVGMRERVSLLGGTLDIESHPGRGTTVVARIPVPAAAEGVRV